MALTVEILAKLTARETSAADLGTAAFPASLEKVLQLASGTGANQADRLWTDERTIAASSSETLDLAGVLASAFGATITMAKVVAILIVADAGNVNNVVIGDASNPLALFGGTNPTHAIKPGGVFLVAAPAAAGLATVGAGTTDELKVANSGSGTGVTYKIAVVGRSA